MKTFESKIEINAPVERVWDVLTAVVDWPQWLPTVSAVEPIGSTRLAVGASYRLAQPNLRPAIWTVVEVVPWSHFDWTSRSPGLQVIATHRLATGAGASTHVTLRITYAGPLSGLVGLIAARLTRDYLDREAKALKRRVESLA